MAKKQKTMMQNIMKGYKILNRKYFKKRLRNNTNIIKGYKIFNPDWTCRGGYQFTCPGIFEEDGDPIVGERGFHFCLNLLDCFFYRYSFDPENKIAEVIALGEIDSNGVQFCTNKIKIVRELDWKEVLNLVNKGKNCSGFNNNGNHNSGDCNTGNHNSGNGNKGNHNSGSCNKGDYNSGYGNVGDWNSGNGNKGNYNSGGFNTGHYNSGLANTGNYNSGNANKGNHNSGDWNTGDWNKTTYSSGCFNTETPKIHMFNKLSDWTYEDWLNSVAYNLLDQISCDNKKFEDNQRWWNELSDDERLVILSLPNFDPIIFERITGIKTKS